MKNNEKKIVSCTLSIFLFVCLVIVIASILFFSFIEYYLSSGGFKKTLCEPHYCYLFIILFYF